MNGKTRYQFMFLIINTTLYGLDIAFTLHCPFSSQWKLTARGKCYISDAYQCLYDVNKLQNIQVCQDRPHFEAPGYKIQIVGSLEGVQCASNRYQPFIFWTNESSICKFEKSTCADEGQIPLSLGTTKADSTCRCDYTKGYDFVVRPRNMCFCVPSEEDCSCFIRNCPNGFVLSPDYKCASVDELLTNTRCPIPTIRGEDPEVQILFRKPDISHGTHHIQDVYTFKIVVSVLILLLIGICVVYIIIVCIYQRNNYTDEQKMQTAIPILLESLKDSLIRFKPTHASDEILKAIKEKPCVLITGPFGSGKTSIAYYIISKLGKEGYETTFASDLEQIKRHFHPNKKQLFLMDDILGKYSSNISFVVDKLEKCGSTIHPMFKTSDTIKVLITCRTYIFQLYAQYFEALREHVPFIHKNLIAENLRLNLEERKEIYQSYFESDPPELISDDILLLYQFYPLICSSYNKEFVLNYFKHPHKIVAVEISSMQRHSDTGYLALAILVVLNDKVDKKMLSDIPSSKKTSNIIFQEIFNESGFNQYPSKHTLRMTFMSLNGEFIKENETLLSFLCPELFEIVASCIGESFIQSIIKYSSSSFIKEKLQLFPKQKNNCSTAVRVNMNMEHKYYQRLTFDMKNNCIDDVLKNELFKSKEHRELFLVHIRKHVNLRKLVDSSSGSNVIHILSSLGYSDLIRAILEFPDCPDINKRNLKGETPLHITCEKGHLRIVQWLIKRGAEVNKVDNNKRAALHVACQTGNSRIVEYLIRNNSPVNGTDVKGMTPINIACANGHSDVVKYLIEKGANVNIADTNCKTPLHYACQNSMCKIVEMLLLKRALVNKPDDQGYTPLHISCEYGNEEIVKLLVKHGAVTSSKNKQELTPMDIALKNRLENISSFLQQFKTSK